MSGSVRAILLIGLRASGKSTVGPRLAERLGWSFVDLDDLTATVLRRHDASEALRELGEKRFRVGEVRALARSLERSRVVVALGGGTPTAPGAEVLIRRAQESGDVRVIYLRAEPGVLAERLAADDGGRPALTDAGVVEEVERLFAERDPLYQELAEAVMEVGELGVEEVEARCAEVVAG